MVRRAITWVRVVPEGPLNLLFSVPLRCCHNTGRWKDGFRWVAGLVSFSLAGEGIGSNTARAKFEG